jgi:predicted transcriptional regulator of viral defense system
MESIEQKISQRINTRGQGSVVTPADFLDLGSRQAVDLALHRLVKKGTLRRIARGLYDYPRVDPELGPLAPSIDAVVAALQGRDHTTIQAAGGYAANQLGLSDQVPLKIVFYTDGPERRVALGKRIIVFKHTTPRRMATANRMSGLVIQALRHIGKAHVDAMIIARLRQRLSRSEKQQLLQDSRYAPAWVGAIMRRIADDEETV